MRNIGLSSSLATHGSFDGCRFSSFSLYVILFVVAICRARTDGHCRSSSALPCSRSSFILCPQYAIFLTQRSYYASQVYTREFVPLSSTAPSHSFNFYQ